MFYLEQNFSSLLFIVKKPILFSESNIVVKTLLHMFAFWHFSNRIGSLFDLSKTTLVIGSGPKPRLSVDACRICKDFQISLIVKMGLEI